MRQFKLRKKILFGMILAIPLVAIALIATQQGAKSDGVPFQEGDVLAGVGNGLVKHFNGCGNLVDTLNTTSNSNEETGMAFDQNGNLYITNFTDDSMTKYDVNGVLLQHPWGGPFSSHPESVVVDGAGNIYVGEADGSARLQKFDSSGNFLDSWNPDTQSRGLDWIDLAADQQTIFYTSEGNLVKRFDVNAGVQLADFATVPTSPSYALRIRANGEVLVASSSEVHRLASDGTVMQSYTGAGLGETSFLFALNLDPDGTSFWTAGYSTGNIYKIDIETGNLLCSFNAGIGPSLAGIAVFGEPTAARCDNVVTFDEYPDGGCANCGGGGNIAPGTDISCCLLQAFGIKISGVSGTNGNAGVYTNVQGNAGDDNEDLIPLSGNYITTLPNPGDLADSDYGVICIDFVDPVTSRPRPVEYAELHFLDVEDSIAYMTAYSGSQCSGQVIDEATTTENENASQTMVSVGSLGSEGAIRIASVRIIFGSGADSAAVDQLCFRFAETTATITSDSETISPIEVRPGGTFQINYTLENVSDQPFSGSTAAVGIFRIDNPLRRKVRTFGSEPIDLPAGANILRTETYTIPLNWGNNHIGQTIGVGQLLQDENLFYESGSITRVTIIP